MAGKEQKVKCLIGNIERGFELFPEKDVDVGNEFLNNEKTDSWKVGGRNMISYFSVFFCKMWQIKKVRNFIFS